MATGKQIRAARMLAEWDAKDLAKQTGMSMESIFNIERGNFRPREATMEKFVQAFANIGIEFTEFEGVRRKPAGIEIFEGHDRFQEFTDYIYAYLKQNGGDVCVSATDERFFSRYRKDHDAHRQHMKELVEGGRVTFRILASESKFTSEYAEHRFVPKDKNAVPTSFYAFGDCLALISFAHNPAPYVVLHKSGPFAKAFVQGFNIEWEHASPPPKRKTT